MQLDPIVIVSAKRTPIGKFLGDLKGYNGHQLGTEAIRALLTETSFPVDKVNEVNMGCVLPAGLGQAPARQAALHAGLPVTTACTTINKVCGSGMKAVMLAHDAILLGGADIMIAGGMESMTNAPYLLAKARQGYRLGHDMLYDHMTLDGLEDAYDKGKAMGVFAEACAHDYHITKAQQDEFAIESFKRAQIANQEGYFSDEIVPLTLKTKQGDEIIKRDEPPFAVKFERIPDLKPVFQKEGTVTAGNASSIADGAAAMLLMRESTAKQHGLIPLARIVAHVSFATKPNLFTIAPIDAIKQLLTKISWSVDEVDLFEINEAFAVVTLAAMQELHIPHDKINVHGGGCALGHPIGATGARIIVTLLHALKRLNKKRGVASLCIGGGEATAMAFEMLV